MKAPVIVGGGLAGGAAASLLAARGLRPIVLERERGPRDKICGEFLSTEAQAHLAALGLDPSDLGGAPIRAVRMVAGDRVVERPLPFTALGLTRRRLDEALLEHAERLGAEVRRGVTVRRVDGVQLDTTEGALAAPALLLASGKHDVRGVRRDPAAGTLRGMVGFKSHWRLTPGQRAALSGFVEVVMFDGGYAGLQPVEDGLANLCLVIHQKAFEAAGQAWPALLQRLSTEPHLARRLEHAQPVTARPLTVADIPYGHVHRGHASDAVYRLGDQAAVIPSFCGDGMAIALHSARLAARAVLEGATPGAYHRRLSADVARQVRLAVWLQRRAEGWPGRHATVAALGMIPAALPRLAAWTRVPQAALRRAGLGAA